MQVAAGDPDDIAGFATHLAVVTLGAEQGDFLPGLEVADDAVAIGRPATHEGGQAVADPALTRVGGFFGLQGAAQGNQGTDHAKGKSVARAQQSRGVRGKRRRHRTRDRHDGLRVK
ncbi:hypothetical protein D3C76_1510760 [compost metagenome]